MMGFLKRIWIRGVVFDAGERDTFLMLLETQLSKDMPISKVMRGFHAHPYTDVIEGVASSALDAINEGKELATYWADEYYFSQLEAKLMIESQRRQGVTGLITAIRYLREAGKDEVSFWGAVVKKNLMYIIASTYLVAFTIYMGLVYKDTFAKTFAEVGKTTDDLRLFRFADIFINYGLIMLVALALFSSVYMYYRRNLTEIGGRELANRFLLFNFFDRRFQYEVAGMMSAFLRLDIQSLPATQAIIDVYTGSHFQSTRMLLVKSRLEAGESPVEAFRDSIFNDFNFNMLALNCPDERTESMASGYEVLMKISGQLLQRDFMRVGRLALVTSLGMALFVMLGLTEFATVMQEGADGF